MYKLKYDEIENKLIQIDPHGKETVIASEFPSKPVFSPNNQMAIYINPLEWECLGSLYLYNLQNGYIEEIISPDEDQNIPKYAIWIDNNNIAVIIGYGFGTVQVGGNVFIYHIPSAKLKKITSYPPEIQITKLTIKGEIMSLNGIKYIDEALNEFREYYDEIPLSQLF